MVTLGEPYVERLEKALIETVVLSELRNTPEATLDQLVMSVRGVGGWTHKVTDADILECVKRLDRDGHVDEQEERYTLTPDGREDVQKAEFLLRNVSATVAASGGHGRQVSTAPGGSGTRRGL